MEMVLNLLVRTLWEAQMASQGQICVAFLEVEVPAPALTMGTLEHLFLPPVSCFMDLPQDSHPVP